MLTAGTLLALLVIWTVVLTAPWLRRRRDDTAASIEEFNKQLRAIAPGDTMRDVQHPTQRP